MSGLSRRTFLALAGAGTLAAAGSGAASYAAITGPQPWPSTSGPVVRSVDGLLTATLTAADGPAVVAGRRVSGLSTYNGRRPGPVLRIRAGDRMRLRLRNQTSLPTNLHFHGMHVSPLGHEDNVFVEVESGKQFVYDVDVPRDHPGGVYWYHPHRHGYVGTQVYGGLAGLIVVEGGAADHDQIAPLRRRFLTLSNIGLDGMDGTDPQLTPYADALPQDEHCLVNGQLMPTIAMRPGETQFWQICNMGSAGFYQLHVPGGRLQVVEEDGVQVWEPWQPEVAMMPPGKRLGLLVTAPDRATTTTLRTDGYFQSAVGDWPAMDIAYVEVAGDRQRSVVVDSPMRERPAHLTAPVARRRLLTMSESNNPYAVSIGSQFWFNDVPFEQITMKDVFTVQLGTVEEWVIRNGSSTLAGTPNESHPFHQHVNGFTVVERGTWDPRTGESTSSRQVTANGEADTVTVEPNEWVRLRTYFGRYVGRTVYHCHILFHEDRGMMGIFDIVDAEGNGAGPDQLLPTATGHH